MRMKIKTGIITDRPLSGDIREDVEFIAHCLRAYGQLDIEVVAEWPDGHFMLPDGGLDLLAVDYGGIAALGSSAIAETSLRHIRNWAEEHPSCIVVIWTPFTVRVYAWVEEDFGAVANVWYDDQAMKLARLHCTDDDWPIYVRLRAYFGVPAPTKQKTSENVHELVTPKKH